MKTEMDIARLVTGTYYGEIEKEIFELVKKDQEWLADIVRQYAQIVAPTVSDIKQLVHEYHNPMTLEETEEEK